MSPFITNSERLIKPLVLPERFDATEIVDTWWEKSELVESEKDTLRFFAAAVSSLPRTVDLSASFVKNWGDNPINSSFVEDFYKHVISKIKSIYQPQLPSLRLLQACVFRKPIIIDNEVMKAIRASELTNSLDAICPDQEVYIIPAMSLVMLNAAKSISQTADETLGLLIKNITSNIFNEMVLSTKASYKSGYMLETFVKDCFRLRMMVASKHQVATGDRTTLADLVGITPDLLELIKSKESIPTLETPLNLKFQLDRTHRMVSSSYDEKLAKLIDPLERARRKTELDYLENIAMFEKEFASLEVSEDSPLHIILSIPGDKWDIAIKIRRPDGSIFYFIVDGKSKNEAFPVDPKGKLYSAIDRKQYILFEEEFSDLDFLYVYYTTFEGVSSAENRWLVMERKNTLNFLGMFAELFCVAKKMVSRKEPISM